MTREEERIIASEKRCDLRLEFNRGMSIAQIAQKYNMQYESVRRAVEFSDSVAEQKRRQRDRLAACHPCGIRKSEWHGCYGQGCHNRETCDAYKSVTNKNDGN